MIKIHTFHNPIEADFCKGKLEVHDIPCLVQPETYQFLMPGPLPWEIRLLGREEDAQEALEVLGFAEKQEQKAEASEPTCLNCGKGPSVRRTGMGLATILASLGLGHVLAFKLRKCQACGPTF